MYKTIVLGLDGSECSFRAIPHAVEAVKASGGSVIAVYVEEQFVGRGEMATPFDTQQKEAVEAQIQQLRDAGVAVKVETAMYRLGGPGQVIAEVAEAADADLIVIGTRGRSTIPGLILGSVAHRLVHIARRPVLAIPPA